MAYAISPSVTITERDLTNVVPAVATTAGAFAGYFQWGPVQEVRRIDSEKTLVSTFFKPDTNTYGSFYSAANFLSYGNNLQVVRTVGAAARNAVASGTAVKIDNEVDYVTNYSAGQGAVGSWAAKFPGTLGNSLKVSIADSVSYAAWDYKDLFTSAPGTSSAAAAMGGSLDEVHVVVIDEDGLFSGVQGEVLETFAFASKASDLKNNDGTRSYYADIVNTSSKYVWWMDHPASMTDWGTSASANAFVTLAVAETVSLTGGVNAAPSDAELIAGYDIFANDEQYDISLVFAGDSSVTVGEYLISNIAETRRDCVAFISPKLTDVVNNVGQEATDIITTRNLYPSSSYAVMDSGYKYQYDRYNDVYRWIPLNADIAGLCARTDNTTDPWFSPAGFNRGQIKNVVKLAYSPRKTDRDTLYNSGVNPVVSFPGQGTVLFGDKTLLSKPSAFDRINVRRLFIVLEKAIATASKYQLFELNDIFTRAQFKNLVEPFLRDVQGRRGVENFLVVCDETNNTGEVVSQNRFVGDIFVMPSYSINYVQLNFIASKSGVAFQVTGA